MRSIYFLIFVFNNVLEKPLAYNRLITKVELIIEHSCRTAMNATHYATAKIHIDRPKDRQADQHASLYTDWLRYSRQRVEATCWSTMTQSQKITPYTFRQAD